MFLFDVLKSTVKKDSRVIQRTAIKSGFVSRKNRVLPLFRTLKEGIHDEAAFLQFDFGLKGS